MSGYSPLKITGNATGLIQNREEFLLPDDAYPNLQNAYVWRERILRKRGCRLLGRLRRSVTVVALPLVAGEVNLISALGLEATASIAPGSISLTGSIDLNLYTDPANDGILVGSLGGSGTINYATGALTISGGAGETLSGTIGYYTNLPSMGINVQELTNSAVDQTVFFDQKYAYVFDPTIDAFREYIPGTTWNAANLPVTSIDFFWSTNYWTSDATTGPFGTTGTKLFWVTNNSGHSQATADPPRITDGTTWVDFTSGTWNQIDASNFLFNWLSMLPFRGRMVTFNTWEGPAAGQTINYRQRIRWATIGNPFIAYTAGPPARGSWRSDIRGQGGYLDIPTAEDIVAVGFVRDNLVIYCEKSTWQLKYTGRSISPFQIEKVNSELGVESPYSSVQFDTSIIGIGQRGIIECDSYKAEKIDIKIPDFVFNFNDQNNGQYRIQGIRDFENRLAYWTIPFVSSYDPALVNTNYIFPNIRLVYNYENDSWALFNDSFTTLGNYQTQSFRTWLNTPLPWIECDFTWIDQPISTPILVAGNQQGFIVEIDKNTTNDPTLYISDITGNQGMTVEATLITSPNHNLKTNMVIGIRGIAGTDFTNLNGGIFGIDIKDANSFYIYKYDPNTGQFSDDQVNPVGTYGGGGLINVRDNFSVVSKKFNFLDEGQSIQIGYIDVLMRATAAANPGAITLNVYLDYDDVSVSNRFPDNQISTDTSPAIADTFFNSVIPTIPSNEAIARDGTKFWQRVFCPTRANFVTLEYTFSNAQMAGIEQQQPVQIDAQILWIRKAGRISQF